MTKYTISNKCRYAKHAATVDAAKKERGLQNLEGTKEQVAWADSIREEAYRALDLAIRTATTAHEKQAVASWKKKMDAESTAAWWIDKRDILPSIVDVKYNINQLGKLFD